eukprot:TRINITY_DN5670_c0_g1_i1.p1 TRINITY_DN5670_c0_g1~~TRINITY_DN5670_c0_g1_i1.p1  ORF type:complete len:190 (+),score=36.26 TRINITY_DN5670_c0_g1_i1:48-617(+)
MAKVFEEKYEQGVFVIEETVLYNKSVVHLHPSALEELGLFRGDTVTLTHPENDENVNDNNSEIKETCAIVLSSDEIDQTRIRCNNVIRNNLGLKIGEKLKILRVEIDYLKKIKVKCTNENGIPNNFSDLLRSYFQDAYRPVSLKDIYEIEPHLINKNDSQNIVSFIISEMDSNVTSGIVSQLTIIECEN